MKRLAAMLLAGGASVRMGQPKALLLHQGRPLWQWQMKTLQALRPDELYLSAPAEITFGEGPWKTLHDREAGLGPLGGLQAALKAGKADRLVMLAVDMPEITAEFLGRLLEEAGERGLVSQLEGFYHGTVAIYPAGILSLVEDVLASEDRSFQHLVRLGVASNLLGVHVVSEAEKPLFRNLNRPSDLNPNPP